LDAARGRGPVFSGVPAFGDAEGWSSPWAHSPNGAWLCQQTKNFFKEAADLYLMPKHVLRDNVTKFFAQFEDVTHASDGSFGSWLA
jgi:hypothetical protein